ncbi:replication-associated protein [Blackfly DNA Virus 11]|nr:replication-associated protein [Blackfly DNA Virus 11]
METFPTPYQLHADEELDNSDEDFLDSVPKDVPGDVPSVAAKPVPGEKTKSKFRLQGKKFFLTYAQCAVKKEKAVERIKRKWPTELAGYVVCEEQHKDGSPHLHVFLMFLEKQQFYGEYFMDFITQKHGNYKGVNSIRGSINYTIKGSNYVSEGFDIEAILAKKGPKSTAIAKMILEGKSMVEINEKDPGYVMMNKRKLEEYESWVTIQNNKKSKITWVPPNLEGLTDSNKQIAQWICSNVRQTRKFKAPQLFITGPKNLGKTSLIEWLERSLSVYHIPQTEEFYDLYSDSYDLVVFDEFKGQKTIQWMNLFLQGSPMNIRKKGSQFLKQKNLPVIILSNYQLGDCYPRARDDGRLDTLLVRLDIVEVDSFIDFYKDREELI